MKSVTVTSLTIVLIAAALVALPRPVAAADPENGRICTDATEETLVLTEDCADVCIDENECNHNLYCYDGVLRRDCWHYNHDHNLCPDPPICVPDYEYTFLEQIGIWDVDDYYENTCTLYAAALMNKHDKNQCQGHEDDVIVCMQGPAGVQQYEAGQCCGWQYNCWGVTCGG